MLSRNLATSVKVMGCCAYVPESKLTIIGNHKPVLRNIDGAARRRFIVIPITRKSIASIIICPLSAHEDAHPRRRREGSYGILGL
jgi:hypothetical protein